MAVRDITYLKSRFQNGDTPDENDFIDLFDTLFAQAPASSPLVVPISGVVLVDGNDPKENLAFEVDISLNANFSPLVLEAKTLDAQANWEFWNGTAMLAMPAGGLNPSYQDADIGFVCYTWVDASRGVSYYIRYRSGSLGVWGDYRVIKVTA